MRYQVMVNKYSHEGSSFMRDYGSPCDTREEAQAVAEEAKRMLYRVVYIDKRRDGK